MKEHKQKGPLVSVTVPVYNVEAWLPRCLDSLLCQSLREIEIICVDDGSTDGSGEILERYRQRDERIRVIHKENGGLPSARNAAIEAARGEYIGFVDSDDYAEPDMFRRLWETARRDKAEVVICGAQVFPQEPAPEEWLRESLSPGRRHYESFEPELLFGNVGTTPFLWRVLASRELIGREQLRLDESILLGEDKAFQAKLYTKARGISLIPDRLYRYCWRREGSIMEREVYRAGTGKGKAHARLVLHMAGILEGEGEEVRREFLRWSIPFLYGDYIYLTMEEKISLAPAVRQCWVGSGYYRFRYSLESWIREQFAYVESFIGKEPVLPRLSVVVPIWDSGEYVQELLDGLGRQSLRETEILLINSGAPDETYRVLHRSLFRDGRIRLYNRRRDSYGETLQAGSDLAAGEYVWFARDGGWLTKDTALEEWYCRAVREGADLCMGGTEYREDRLPERPAGKGQTKGPHRQDVPEPHGKEPKPDSAWMEGRFLKGELHSVLFRREFLCEKKIRFADCSLLTGTIFLMKCLTAAGSRDIWQRNIYTCRRIYEPDWFSREAVRNILENLADLMEEAGEKGDGVLQAGILELLGSDLWRKRLVRSTRERLWGETGNVLEKEAQAAQIYAMYRIARAADPQLLEKTGYDMKQPGNVLLCELVRERQRFLAEIST